MFVGKYLNVHVVSLEIKKERKTIRTVLCSCLDCAVELLLFFIFQFSFGAVGPPRALQPLSSHPLTCFCFALGTSASETT